MRDLLRNKRKIWYANFVSSSIKYDDNGNEMGAVDEYTDPALLRINVSAATGEAAAEAFGAFTDYNRTLATADMSCPLQEGSHVWFGVEPEAETYNYVVVKSADSVNGLLFALKEVSVS